MSKTNAWENAFQQLMFNNNNAANIGDAAGLRGSSSAGSFYLSLHTSDPGEAGDQSTNEIAYTSYARVAVARTSGGFSVSGNSVSPASNVNWPACTGGSGTATHFGIGSDASGAGNLFYSGTLTPNIAVSTGVTPQMTTASTFTED